jgi:hypothetical protein
MKCCGLFLLIFGLICPPTSSKWFLSRKSMIFGVFCLVPFLTASFAAVPCALAVSPIGFERMMDEHSYCRAIDLVPAKPGDKNPSIQPRLMYDLGSCHFRLAHLYEELYELGSYLGSAYYPRLKSEVCSGSEPSLSAGCGLLGMLADMYHRIVVREAVDLGEDNWGPQGFEAIHCPEFVELLLHGASPRGDGSWAREFCQATTQIAKTLGPGCAYLSMTALLCDRCFGSEDGVGAPLSICWLDSLVSQSIHKDRIGASANQDSAGLVFLHGLMLLRQYHLDEAEQWCRSVLEIGEASESLKDGARYQLAKCMLLRGNVAKLDETLGSRGHRPSEMLRRCIAESGVASGDPLAVLDNIKTERDASMASDVILLLARVGEKGNMVERLVQRCSDVLKDCGSRNSGAYARLGEACLRSGHYKEASDLFARSSISPVTGHETFPPAYIVAYVGSMCREEPVPYKYALMLLYRLERRNRVVFPVRKLLLGLAVQNGIDIGVGLAGSQ